MQWFERRFDVLNPNLSMPGILERLKGTPWRLRGMLNAIPTDALTRVEDGWSIQEHIGHLCDLEPLWLDRTRELMEGAEVLTSADLENRKTHEANHNDADLESILGSFSRYRLVLVSAFQHLQQDKPGTQAKHPRLGTPMRPVDLAYFVAEHDDHHLAAINAACERMEIW